MQRVKLGKSDLEVPVLCLGGNVYGWTLPEAESLRQLDAALEAGLNFIDTADVYSRWMPGHTGGESEAILGKWLAKGNKRSNVILATKVGLEMGEGKKGLSAAYIEQAVEASLRRLQTDYIDLYQALKKRWLPSTSWCGRAKYGTSALRTTPAHAWQKRCRSAKTTAW
jgi:aryl-alcohol dehydrogenase-like predicted oxidoreductase